MNRRLTGAALASMVCLATLAPGAGDAGTVSARPLAGDVAPAAAAPWVLRVAPDILTVGQHVGGPGEAPLAFEFTVPVTLRGGGPPLTINTGIDGDRSVLQIELPLASGYGNDTGNVSTGADVFDKPLLCWKGVNPCPTAGQDGSWSAVLERMNGTSMPLQVGIATRDPIALLPYPHILGIYLPTWQYFMPGDRVRLQYAGFIPRRATAATSKPLRAHARYRTFVAQADVPGLAPGPWSLLTDDQVQPLVIQPLPDVAFVRAIAPLDIEAGAPFTVSIVLTDRYGNPRPITGEVVLSGGVEATVPFAGEWRREVTATYADPGSYRIVPAYPGARPVYHYSRVSSGPPPLQRLVGDLHMHSGDGGMQRQFLGWITPGDHTGLFTTSHDALDYARYVAGLDFAALTEHSVRTDAYQLPPAVAADPQFAPGGACTGDLFPIHGLGDWWSHVQQQVRDYDAAANGSFIVMQGYEWHSHHLSLFVTAFLHRIVLFRDLDPAGALPILPGDIRYIPPQCLIRFYDLLGYGPDRVMVIPHMMSANKGNIDWDYAYLASTPVAPPSLVEQYQRVGEIFSARNYNQQLIQAQPYYDRESWTAFEGRDDTPGVWSYRYGWRNRKAHIGLIGSSDNHSQMPGVNDDMATDGSRFHENEPAGSAVVLAPTRDRGAVFDSLGARRSYATSGVRAWLGFDVDGAPMGSAIARSADTLAASIDLMAGMALTRVELWGVQVGNPFMAYKAIASATPGTETYATGVALSNPVPAGGRPQEWMYYVRGFMETAGAEDGQSDEVVWSSPIWVTWSR